MQLIDALFDLTKASSRPIIAIDGPAGAGKSTLAEHLSAALALKYRVQVLHMDDLYNGWQNAFDHHLADSLITIAKAHQSMKEISISRFDWHQGEYRPPELLPAAELLIFEGVGSSQTPIREFLSASIWIEIDRQKGIERVLHRDGQQISSEMEMWLELQEQHFLQEGSEKAADFVLTN